MIRLNPKTLENAATGYMKQGYQVVPLGRGEKGNNKPLRRFGPKHPIKSVKQVPWASATGIAIVLGAKEAVLDVDNRNGGMQSLQALIKQSGPEILDTRKALTGDGAHFHYVGSAPHKTDLGPGLELLGKGHLVTMPPSLHHNGSRYSWLNSDPQKPMQSLPLEILKYHSSKHTHSEMKLLKGGKVPRGDHNNMLIKIATSLAKYGLPEEGVFAGLKGAATNFAKPCNCTDQELHAIARWAVNNVTPRSGKDGRTGSQGVQPSGQSVELPKVVPYESPIPDGSALLDEIQKELERFLVLPPHASAVLTLWCVLTHCFASFDICAKIVLYSPTPECGKTTTLEIMFHLVRQPMISNSITAAALYRAIDKYHPTLLIDEIDTFINKEGGEELRGVINCGHKKSTAYVFRCVGQGTNLDLKGFCTFAPQVLAGISKVNSTIATRSITLPMQRKEKSDLREKATETNLKTFDVLARKIARWVDDNLELIARAKPLIPNLPTARAEDNWTPLLCIAEVAGGTWPAKAQAAAIVISRSSSHTSKSLKEELLVDLKEVFGAGDKLPTAVILDRLTEMHERPWGEIRKGKPINNRWLANALRDFGVQSRDIRWLGVGMSQETVLKGYLTSDLKKVWTRYGATDSTPPSESATTLHNPPSATASPLALNTANTPSSSVAPEAFQDRGLFDATNAAGSLVADQAGGEGSQGLCEHGVRDSVECPQCESLAMPQNPAGIGQKKDLNGIGQVDLPHQPTLTQEPPS